MSAEKQTEVLVIHVRGQEERRQFIQKQLDKLGFPYTFVTDGNVEDLTSELLDRYFAPGGEINMHGAFPRTSCAYKHILAMQHIVEHHLPGALVMEDDLRIFPNFRSLFLQSLEEIELLHPDEPLIANYEESSLLLVPHSKLHKGTVLYPATRDRYAGCMYITRKAAEVILTHIDKEKSRYNSDRLHNHLIEKGIINYYWSYPCGVCQCSCDGSMPTMIPTRPRPLKRLKWFYKRFYKHLLAALR